MDEPLPAALSPDAIVALGEAMLDWTIPDDCLDGVGANLLILAAHRRILEDGR